MNKRVLIGFQILFVIALSLAFTYYSIETNTFRIDIFFKMLGLLTIGSFIYGFILAPLADRFFNGPKE